MTTRSVLGRATRGFFIPSALALLAVLASPSAVRAGGGAAELGFDAGWTDLTDNAENDSGTRFGLRGGYLFKPWFQLEAQASRTSADEAGLEARLNTVFVNGVFNMRPTTRIEPYVLTGVGRANMKVSASGVGSVDDSGAAYQVGAGSRFFLNDSRNIAIRVELARLHERSFDDGTDYNNVTTGLTWRPGRRS